MYALFLLRQAEAYFAQQQKQLKRKEKEAKMKKKLMKMKKEEMEIHERQRAYRLFEKYLVKSFKYACAHTPPPLVTERVRQLSDIILEHLCDMCNADVPDRSEDTGLNKLRFLSTLNKIMTFCILNLLWSHGKLLV